MPAIYEAIAYGMRYWFILVVGVMLLGLVSISVSEYRKRKSVMGEISQYVGYMEIIYGDEDVLGTRIGIARDNIVGSARTADIYITHPSIQKNQCRIYMEDEAHMMLEPLKGGVTKINGRRCTTPHEIFTGDIVTFGDVDVEIYVREEQDEADA